VTNSLQSLSNPINLKLNILDLCVLFLKLGALLILDLEAVKML